MYNESVKAGSNMKPYNSEYRPPAIGQIPPMHDSRMFLIEKTSDYIKEIINPSYNWQVDRIRHEFTP